MMPTKLLILIFQPNSENSMIFLGNIYIVSISESMNMEVYRCESTVDEVRISWEARRICSKWLAHSSCALNFLTFAW